jgi:hypothetical protein
MGGRSDYGHRDKGAATTHYSDLLTMRARRIISTF